MTKMNGWLKLHRKALENPVVMKSPEHLAVWIYLLCHATPQTYKGIFNGEETELSPGQLITSRVSIAESFARKTDIYKVQRILKQLEKARMIAQKTGNKNRLITVLNWEKYQSVRPQERPQPHFNRTSTAPQTALYKEYKEEKEIKESFKSEMSIDELWENSDRSDGYV